MGPNNRTWELVDKYEVHGIKNPGITWEHVGHGAVGAVAALTAYIRSFSLNALYWSGSLF